MMAVVISFFTSAVLIAALLVLRHWELSRGNRLAEDWRARMDEGVMRIFTYCSREFPRTALRHLTHAAINVSHRVATFLLGITQRAERRLRALSDMVKGRKHVAKNARPASAFLNDVVEHKRNGNGQNKKSASGS